MSDLTRIRELAGLTEKSYKVKQLTEYSFKELKEQQKMLAAQLAGSTILTEHVATIKYKLQLVEAQLEKTKEVEEKPKSEKSDCCKKCENKKDNAETCKCECHKNSKEIEESVEAEAKRIQEAKDGAEFQDAQPSAAIGKDDVGNIFDGTDEEKSNQNKLEQDALGITQDRETVVKTPADVMAQINQRIKELKASIEMYDKTTYVEQYSNKQKAIENLEFIRDKLKMNNMEAYKQAQIHYGTLASIFAGNLFPAKLVDFLHDGMASEEKEVAYGDYMKGNKDKPEEKDVPGSAIYKTLNTSIYPQKGEGNKPKPE